MIGQCKIAEGGITMKRYVDVDELYDAVCDVDWSEGEKAKEDFLLEILCAQEVNVAEVVRCHNCAYCRYELSSLCYKCDRRGFYSEEVDPNDFCSKAKKKEIKYTEDTE
jgi:hypothetical protein